MQTGCTPTLALAVKIVQSETRNNTLLLVASRPGRGEPSLVMSDNGPIIWEGEDGVKEFLCLSPDLEREAMRRIRTEGLLVFEAKDIIQHGTDAQPLTMLKI